MKHPHDEIASLETRRATGGGFPVVMLAFLLLFPVAPVGAVDLSAVSSAVVKLYVTRQGWDIRQPWAREQSNRRTCSGFFIKQGILTNAHCVMDATFIQIEVPGLADKIEAERVAVNHQSDLALLRPRDPEALPRGIEPIRFGKLPESRDKVVTVGYAIGGRQVSYTEGVVSRIDIMAYAHSGFENLLVQTDAAINMGNSGGPVFSDETGDCVGVATQRFSGTIGYFVPGMVIEHFLADLKDGRVDGVPFIGVNMQSLENPALRASLGMTPEQSGLLVTRVADQGGAESVLQVNDVLLSVAGARVFNDGRIILRDNSRIGVGYEISRRQVGESLPLTVLRNGKVIKQAITLTSQEFKVIPTLPQYDTRPRYYVMGGLMFRAVEPRYYIPTDPQATVADIPFNIRKYFDTPRNDIDGVEELVVISDVFEAEVNVGYGGLVENTRVATVNGHDIRRLEDVAAAFVDNTGEYQVIDLEDKRRIVLRRALVEVEESRIRQRYNIP
ncbi:MAG: trypsin-like peptidase domain-containing protein [Gammaproteobacteria bacterium]|nr:trypsin-like peptidase domain-containing protein [Gammaproteobacteria bacterium]